MGLLRTQWPQGGLLVLHLGDLSVWSLLSEIGMWGA
jgi:hypothetical protein